MTEKIRLNKYLANLGIASRRAIDEYIVQGKITLNGKKLTQLGVKIDPAKDQITFNGQKINPKSSVLTYIILNKPKGILSTSIDTHYRKTVLDLVKVPVRLYPVGRLDLDSHGIILLTNDGDLTLKLTHPKYHVPKVYRVNILGFVSDTKISQLRTGVALEDSQTAPCKVIAIRQTPRQTTLEITLFEGKKRQIRRMCAALHLHLTDLQRIAIGPIKLENLNLGKWRKLTDEEVTILKKFKPVKIARK